jgi:hypothetical protein
MDVTLILGIAALNIIAWFLCDVEKYFRLKRS